MIQKLLFFLRKATPSWAFKTYHFILAFIGHALYGFPSKKLVVVGVTGTNGKTTTAVALAHILKKAGIKVAVSTSALFQIDGITEPNLMMVSMPGRFVLPRFLSRALRVGCQIVIVESTSEGVLQYRHRFIDYDYFVVTNLRPEHIERHGSFENYKRAKLELVKRLGRSKKKELSNYRTIELSKGIVVNLDDEYAKDFLDVVGETRKVGVTFKEQTTDDRRQTTRDSEFLNFKFQNSNIQMIQCSYQDGDIVYHASRFTLHVPGLFNAYNVAVACAGAVFLGIPLETALGYLSDFSGVPGRFEVLRRGNVSVVVDYAHEPFSLEQVLRLAKETYPGLLVHVFGATGGGRDVWKRTPMGEVSARFADRIILTNDDPYDEDQKQIANQIREGVADEQKVELILDRRSAIRKGIEYAREHSGVVVVTGKGTETVQCFERGRSIPWSDRAVVLELLGTV